MLLFPPWNYYDSDSSGRSSAGYHFFLKPPDPTFAHFKYQVRFPEYIRTTRNDLRLTIQMLITIPIILGLVLVLRTKRSAVTIIPGVLCFLSAAFVAGFVLWMIVGEGLQDGDWTLP